MDALELLLNQKRFDLIYKYLYVSNPCDFNRRAYIENIRAFNGFVELEPSDGVPKNSAEDFVRSFDLLITNLKQNGFNAQKGLIPIQKNGEISDGAHRLAACAALNIDVATEQDEQHQDMFSYEFFQYRKMDSDVMDYGALEYVKLNPDAYIVNLHAVNNPKYDALVHEILNKYGWIYYQRNINMNLNGYVNLVKLSYGSFWEREKWIGDESNGFEGALKHARMSYGRYPMRIFVFVCDDLQKVLQAKAEIREIYKIGNNSVHINDTHEEAIWLAETYFNKNSLHFIKHRPYKFTDAIFDSNLEYLKTKLKEAAINVDSVCCVGSTPINAYGIRKASDLDYLCLNDDFAIEDDIISPHDDQLHYYKNSKQNIITNPRYFFYYHGLKIGTLNLIRTLKLHRHEMPKDIGDLCSILLYMNFAIKKSPSVLSAKYHQWKKRLRNNKFVYGLYILIKKR